MHCEQKCPPCCVRNNLWFRIFGVVVLLDSDHVVCEPLRAREHGQPPSISDLRTRRLHSEIRSCWRLRCPITAVRVLRKASLRAVL
ncbi:hypothetical protein PF005_g10141 [Phytophthora fragariae]|uniref:Secreted protein n=1 Tax=Phytophthora fragariae TaxID=53985 RepID=A0A6A3T1Z8_9STRA|nr:hypothetical protein PF003_g4591 [Phytophthora fragariae]KAE8952374.1 hypothetical protein PF011_g32722 [Phytophthora fragariae]KAE9128157.1 hypothetical protein PF007_g5351 [Phytophthora fragariae]KAE9146672.1 hypothetical protein PF004_g33009 [Phytophthora fragariae]KAE9213598.1 hypothetical protein PF005_g10141 [Phytophthora fragariae]